MALNYRPRKQTPEQKVVASLEINPEHYGTTFDRNQKGDMVLQDKICGGTITLHNPAVKTLNNHSSSKKHLRHLMDLNLNKSSDEQVPEWQELQEAEAERKLKVDRRPLQNAAPMPSKSAAHAAHSC